MDSNDIWWLVFWLISAGSVLLVTGSLVGSFLQ